MFRRVLEMLVPTRLGSGFRWLLASSWAGNLGDGIAVAAGPLLVVSQTREPVLVASAVLLQQLPWLLFGLHAGALADRIDRRLLVATAQLVRVGVLTLLCVSIATGVVSVPIVLATMFLLGTTEVFADTGSQTLLPMLVHRDDLPTANARLVAGFTTINLAGAPIGAALFTVGAVWAFASQAVLVALGAVLVLQITVSSRVREPGTKTPIRSDIVQGLSWVRDNPAVRTLLLVVFVFGVTSGAAWSVLVLYARQRLHLGPIGFGLITTCIAVGGLVGTVMYGRITRHFTLTNIMRIGLISETLTHLALALTTHAVVALGILTLFGAHAFVLFTTGLSIRQRLVPSELQGRVGSLNMVTAFSTLVAGTALGGGLAQQWGVTAPFWFAFVGSAVFTAVLWRQLRHIAHADASGDAPGYTG